MHKSVFDKPQEYHGRGYIYSYRFCTKYRRKVLQNGVDETCKKYSFGIVQINGIHYLCYGGDAGPYTFACGCEVWFRIPEAMQKIKGNLFRALFVLHPEIKRKLLVDILKKHYPVNYIDTIISL